MYVFIFLSFYLSIFLSFYVSRQHEEVGEDGNDDEKETTQVEYNIIITH